MASEFAVCRLGELLDYRVGKLCEYIHAIV